MPTEEIAARDAYQARAEGHVEEITPEGVVLDRTVFYARGGGQPGDTGVLATPNGDVSVTDTVRFQGRILHVIETPELLEPGMALEGIIDWDRRYRLMRTHTALHGLSGVIYRDFGAKVTGGNMEPGIARMDFELDSMSVELGRQVEEVLNAELVKGYPAEVIFMAREAALADPELIRTKVNLIPEYVKEIRVIDIVGLDRQADGGTHVASTLEVGQIRVTKTESKGRANKRMRIELQ
jgi:misacylated tRNA(Ala) deacylase